MVIYWKPPKLDKKWISTEKARIMMGIIAGYIRNQRFHNLCWAYAACDLISASLILYGWEKEFIPLCPHYLCNKIDPLSYNEDEDEDEDEDSDGHEIKDHTCYGFNVAGSLLYVKKKGIPKERKLRFDCKKKRPYDPNEAKYDVINNVFQYDTLEQALIRLKTHPVSASLLCFKGWADAEIYRGPLKKGARFQGTHEVIMLDCQDSKGEMVVRCKSSNGKKVGSEGYIFVSLKVMVMVVGSSNENGCSIKPTYLLSDFHLLGMITGPHGLTFKEKPNRARHNLKFKMADEASSEESSRSEMPTKMKKTNVACHRGHVIRTMLRGRNGRSRSAKVVKNTSSSVDWLNRDMLELRIREKTEASEDRDSESDIVDGAGAEAGHVIRTMLRGRNGQSRQSVSYIAEHVVGTGSFGMVFQAKCRETGEIVAIKKVLQDKRYKNREFQIMQMLDHPNVVALKHSFYSRTENEEVYLNLVLEFVPETVNRTSRSYSVMNQLMPLIHVKLYTYQICRALAYLHNCCGLCHRDIKPQNLLVNPHTHQLKICDFGSAKVLVKGEPNISYTTAIDIWSTGCPRAELLLGQPLFPGESGVDQLFEIIKVLGPPTREEIKCNYTEFKFPQIKPHPWHMVFQKRLPPEAVDLVCRFFQYSPNLRCTAVEACIHPFFDELRDPNTRLPNGWPLPPLFNFKPQGISRSEVNRAIHQGRPHKFYHVHNGRRVWNVTKCVAVGIEVNKQIGNRIIRKRIHVRVEHVHHQSRCAEELKLRKKKNDELEAAAKAREEKTSTKRQLQGRKPGFMVDEGMTLETDVLKGGWLLTTSHFPSFLSQGWLG